MAFGVGGAIGEAFVVVRPDTRGFAGSAKQGILGPMKGLAVATGGLFAAVGVASFLKDSVDEAREAVKVGKQTTAVIKSTGGAANVTAQQVDTLATALSGKTAIDDEAIASGENLLLTFVNVKNQVGKGNDIFNQATASVLDLSVAFKQDIKSSAIQLGKALNDPVKGVVALSRVGVQFTAQQKDQIKTLVKSGDVLGAQKIILAELRKETGGAAAAAADPWQRFSVVMGNVKESIGTALLPVLNTFLNFIADRLPGAIKTVGNVLRPLIVGFKALGAAFSGEGVTSDGFVGTMERIGVAARKVVDFLTQTVGPALGGIFKAALPVIQAAAGAISTVLGGLFRNFLPAVQAVGAFLGKVFGPAFQAITQAVLPAAAAFGQALLPALRSLVNTFKNDVLPVLKVVGIVIGAVLFLAFTKVVPVILRLVGVVLRLAGPVLGFLLKAVGFVIGRVFGLLTTIGRLVGAFIRAAQGPGILGKAFRAVMAVARVVWTVISTVVRTAFGVISGVVRTIVGLMTGNWRAAFNGAKAAVASAIGGVVSLMRNLPGKIRSALGAIGSLLLQVGKDIIQGLINGIRGSIGGVASAISSAVSSIPGVAKKLLGIGSPSKVMKGIGSDVGKGLALGLTSATGAVAGAAGRLAGSAVAVPRRSGVNVAAAGAGAGGSGVTQHFTLVQQPGQSAPAFIQQAMFAARTQARPA